MGQKTKLSRVGTKGWENIRELEGDTLNWFDDQLERQRDRLFDAVVESPDNMDGMGRDKAEEYADEVMEQVAAHGRKIPEAGEGREARSEQFWKHVGAMAGSIEKKAVRIEGVKMETGRGAEESGRVPLPQKGGRPEGDDVGPAATQDSGWVPGQ